MIRQAFQRIWDGWDQFWFRSHSPERMRLFRILFCGLLIPFYCIRMFDLEFYFAQNGIAPLEILSDLMVPKYRYSLLTLFPGTVALWTFNFIFLGALALLALGIIPRIAAIVTLVIHVSFLHRNPGGTYGVDTISVFYMLFLTMVDYRPAASIPRGDFREMLGSVAFRLAQIQLCVIYGYSGLHKLKGISWWQGDAIWNVMANAQLARWDFSILTHVPFAIVAATYGTLIFEIYFPALVWIKKVRLPLLFGGFLMHLGIGLFMSIPYFAGLMVIIYTLFLTESQASDISHRCVNWIKNTKVKAA